MRIKKLWAGLYWKRSVGRYRLEIAWQWGWSIDGQRMRFIPLTPWVYTKLRLGGD